MKRNKLNRSKLNRSKQNRSKQNRSVPARNVQERNVQERNVQERSARNHDETMVRITDDDLQRFHRNAPAALMRRGGNFFMREVARGSEQVVVGLLPIVGVLALGWSAAELILFFLIRMWTGILCDAIKLCCLQQAIMKFAAVKYDDWHVWVVAQAIRDKQEKVVQSHLRAQYQPWLGVLVDFTFGVVGTIVIWLSLASDSAFSFMDYFHNPSFAFSLVAAVLFQFASLAWELVSRLTHKSSDSQVAIASGGRGLGLFLLMFIAVIASESHQKGSDIASWIMVAANGALVAAGLLNIFGYWVVVHETNWLHKYLAENEFATKANHQRRNRVSSIN